MGSIRKARSNREPSNYFGKRYYSFDHKGWHFIVLDSIGIEYYKIFKPSFDQEQLAWLKADLAATGPKRPIIMVTHVPIATVLGTISREQPDGVGPIADNSFEVHQLLAGYNLKLILQGHLHVWQKSEYKDVQYLISGPSAAPGGMAPWTAPGKAIRFANAGERRSTSLIGLIGGLQSRSPTHMHRRDLRSHGRLHPQGQ